MKIGFLQGNPSLDDFFEMEPFVIISSLLVSFVFSFIRYTIVENNRGQLRCDFFLHFYHPVRIYRQNVATIDDAARDIGQMFIRIVSTLLYAIHPVNNWNEVRGSKANFEPTPIPVRPMHSLVFSLGIFAWPFRTERN